MIRGQSINRAPLTNGANGKRPCLCLPQKELGGGIGETQSFGGQMETMAGKIRPAATRQGREIVAPMVAQIETRRLVEFFEGPPDGHAQPEGGDFPCPGDW